MRLIDIEPFESGKDICGCSIQIRRWGDGYSSVCSISTADIPTIDAVPVVRCKDCKYYQNGRIFTDTKFCFRLKDRKGKEVGYNWSDNDFCGYGERKE